MNWVQYWVHNKGKHPFEIKVVVYIWSLKRTQITQKLNNFSKISYFNSFSFPRQHRLSVVIRCHYEPSMAKVTFFIFIAWACTYFALLKIILPLFYTRTHGIFISVHIFGISTQFWMNIIVPYQKYVIKKNESADFHNRQPKTCCHWLEKTYLRSAHLCRYLFC